MTHGNRAEKENGMKARDRIGAQRRCELRWAVFGFGALLVLLLVLTQLLAAADARSEPVPVRTSQERELDLQSFDWIWSAIRDKHFDPAFGGLDWPAVRDSLRVHPG